MGSSLRRHRLCSVLSSGRWRLCARRWFRFWGSPAGIPCFFWAAYQYLLIVYAASTPGLRVAGLELARFDGTSTSRSLRRWRVLASCLSAVSLGMGYALGLSRRGRPLLARPDHAYLPRAEKAQAALRTQP